jgi:glycosyltransferase involved in cell wall biosynthesis
MPEPMRIMHLLAPAEVGGLETVVATLAAGQARGGMSVMVATLVDDHGRHEVWRAGLVEKGVEVFPLLVRGRRYLSERRAVAELLKDWRPDVVHTHGYRPDVLDAPIARRRGIPTVTTVHGFTGNGVKNRFYEWLQRRAFRRFEAVAAVSGRLAEELRAAGVPASRIHLVRNAWAPSSAFLEREGARAELGLDAGPLVVGWIGRLTPEKDPELMLRAFSLLGEPSAILVMMGDGWMREELSALAGDLGIGDRVRWTGIVPDASRVVKAFDLLALTSRTEGIPMVLLEGMAAGVPIVARAVGGVPEMLCAQEAVLVRTGDDGAMAKAMRSVIASPGEATARAERARLRLRRDFSVGPWVERYLQIYGALAT